MREVRARLHRDAQLQECTDGRGDGGKLRRANALREASPRKLDALGNELPRAVDIDAVFEEQGHDGQSLRGRGTDRRRTRCAQKHTLDWTRDGLFDVERTHAGRLGLHDNPRRHEVRQHVE